MINITYLGHNPSNRMLNFHSKKLLLDYEGTPSIGAEHQPCNGFLVEILSHQKFSDTMCLLQS